MSTQTINGYIVYEIWHGEKDGKFVFQRYPAIKQSNSYIQREICEHELTFDVPDDFDPREHLVAALREQKKKAAGDYAAMVVELDRRINELLAIENTVETT